MAKKTLAKKTATVETENGLNKMQNQLVIQVASLALSLDHLKAGTPIDNLATRMDKIATQLEKQFIKINNAVAIKDAKQAKLIARKKKLTEQLKKVEKDLS